MSREQTLLQRIGTSGERRRTRYEPTATEDLDALMESIRQHLARLLNARHGMSEGMPDYGLPALTDLTVGGDYVESVQDAIRVTVEKYEPRLRRVRVSRVIDEETPRHTLSFRVDAVLLSRTGEHRVWYQTEISRTGEYEVSD